MPRPVVTYLLWAPLGESHVDAFVESYREFAAGIDHELVVAASGDGPQSPVETLLEKFAGIEHTVERFEGQRTDLKTYRELINRRPESTEFVFCNSYARALAPDWVRILVGPLADPQVGIVGPGGSYETPVNSVRWLLGIPLYIRTYTSFPNPHVRTSCFAISRASVEAIDWPTTLTEKRDAYELEGGRKSLTRQLQAKGLRPVVVGRDGVTYELEDWEASGTFRADEQRNLLVADLRTDNFDDGDAAERARLAKYAWGKKKSR